MSHESAKHWPAWTAEALGINLTTDKKASARRAQQSIWRALNIYDDFLDGVGNPADLPSAHRYFREFLSFIYAAELTPEIIKASHQLLAGWEKADRQEALAHRIERHDDLLVYPHPWPRYDDLSRLSQKTLILAIIPALVACPPKNPDAKNCFSAIVSFFKYALAAKQLADDAADWHDDLLSGKLTAVNVLIMKQAKRKNLRLSVKEPEILDGLFIVAAAETCCQQILKLCRQARQAGGKIGIEPDSILIRRLLEPLENNAKRALNFKKML